MSSARSSLKKNKKIFACGASGCVIYPGLDCGESTSCIKKNKCERPVVTKLFMDKKNYENEKKNFDKNNKLLATLDGEEKYFLSNYTDCGPIEENAENKDIFENIPQKKVKKKEVNFSAFDIQKEEKKVITDSELMRAMMMSSNDDKSFKKGSTNKESTTKKLSFYSINFSYLGTPMQNILPHINTIETIKKFLISVKNIFEGIKLLNENKIYHCDIKPQNLVLDDQDKQFKIIDFGQAIFNAAPENTENKEWQLGDDITGYTAGFVSPEYFFYLLDLLPDVTFFGDAENFYYIENTEYKNPNSIKKPDSIIGSEDKGKIGRMLKSYYKTKKGLEEHSIGDTKNVSYYNKLKKLEPAKTYIKNDIWSLGCVLRYIRSELLIKYEKATDDLRTFLMNVIYRLSNVFKKLVRLNVDERPTASQALDLYNEFLEIIEDPTRHSTRKGGRKRRKTLRRKTRKGRRSI
jgi:serine/threonine protein kinase